jgi:hypothetical protein
MLPIRIYVAAIPALQCIVYDLFIIRVANKANLTKDLETQQEVVISMLLRLLQYCQVLPSLILEEFASVVYNIEILSCSHYGITSLNCCMYFALGAGIADSRATSVPQRE